MLLRLFFFSVVSLFSISFGSLALSASAKNQKQPSPCTTESINNKGGKMDLYGFKLKGIDGDSVELSKYQGRVLLIVNTASRCGFTPQYEDLQAIYKRYRNQGFEVLAFPSNDFKQQEPGSNKEIKEFCQTNFNTEFPLFAKAEVTTDKIQPLFKYLTNEANSTLQGPILWNFEKFLISRDGKLVARYRSKVKPTDAEVTKEIEQLLLQKQETKQDNKTCL